MRTKAPLLTAVLPATPCTPEMAKQFRERAQTEGRSIADVQREAFSLFLRRNASLATENSRQTNIEGQS